LRIAFVVARVGEERNLIQKLSLILVEELRKLGVVVDVIPFSRKSLFKRFPLKELKGYDQILISNVGLQCAYYSLFKRLGFIRKPITAISYGSDIRLTNYLINFFNWMSIPAVDLLIVIGPDLVSIAKKRGYKNVYYVPNWAGALA
jgi:hypothetical protein